MDKVVAAYKVNTHKVWGYDVGAGYGGVGTGYWALGMVVWVLGTGYGDVGAGYGDVGAGYGGGGACWELYVPTTVYHLG